MRGVKDSSRALVVAWRDAGVGWVGGEGRKRGWGGGGGEWGGNNCGGYLWGGGGGGGGAELCGE